VDSDNDSAMGDLSRPMSTMSLRSSIYDYVEENGRTFHRYKQGTSPILCALCLPSPFLSSACEHPSAEVVGTDLSPIQPDFVPANCKFEVDDAEDDWIFNHSFDYIHLRMVFHCFKSHSNVMESALENLAPGGWMEWQDYYCDLQAIDDSLKGTALKRWCQLWIEGGNQLGRDMLAPRRYKQMMEDAGFINVTEQRLAIPGNPWPKGKAMKMMGLWQMTNFLDGINAVSMTILTKGLGMSPEEVEVLMVDVRKDIQNLNVHFYFLT
ncbi:S-adenosyl-L-methionine-dependent methyltransferase, partial [Thozetella sp. PMI_491]